MDSEIKQNRVIYGNIGEGGGGKAQVKGEDVKVGILNSNSKIFRRVKDELKIATRK